MWLNRQVYQELRDALTGAVAVKDALAGHNRALEVTLDWFRIRVSQLEQERALMLSKFMGIDVPVQTIERAREPGSHSPYHQMPHFNDVGEEEAKRLGISWNPATGEVLYGGTSVID